MNVVDNSPILILTGQNMFFKKNGPKIILKEININLCNCRALGGQKNEENYFLDIK